MTLTHNANDVASSPTTAPGSLKAKVQAWWNERPCGSLVSSREFASREFFEEVERHRYAQEPHIPEIVRFSDWRDKKVLEVGCGMGTDLLQFARAGACVTGADLTARGIAISSEHFRVYGEKGAFCQSDAENLPFPDNTFDLVYSNGVIHHTPDTRRAVSEIYRVLKPGGTAIVMIYHRNSYNYRVNISLLRRAAFFLMRRGMKLETLARSTGVDIDLLKQYQQAMSRQSKWTRQELLNNNTDGPGNPLSKVYSRREAKRMFDDFTTTRTAVRWLVSKNIPLLGKRMPASLDAALGRLMGWALYVIAVK